MNQGPSLNILLENYFNLDENKILRKFFSFNCKPSNFSFRATQHSKKSDFDAHLVSAAIVKAASFSIFICVFYFSFSVYEFPQWMSPDMNSIIFALFIF